MYVEKLNYNIVRKLSKKPKAAPRLSILLRNVFAQYTDADPYTVNMIVQYFGLCKILYRVKAILKIVQYIA